MHGAAARSSRARHVPGTLRRAVRLCRRRGLAGGEALHLAYNRGRIGRAENRRAGDEDGGPGLRERTYVVLLHAAVDGEVDGACAEHCLDATDLPVRALNERLPAESR